MRRLSDLGGVVVADVLVECRDEHQRGVEVALERLMVGLDADGAAIVGGAKLVEFMSDNCPSISY